MCYELWRSERMRARKKEAERQRAQELVETAKAARPAPPQEPAVVPEPQPEAVAA